MFGRSLKKRLPDPQKVSSHKLLRWLGPTLTRPSLWQANRRSIALGLAIGVFTGLIIPLAQIPLAAIGAVLFRANLPIAMVSTLVTNPFTFAPLYFVAYRLGDYILGLGTPTLTEAMIDAQVAEMSTGFMGWVDRIADIGAPLFTGLFVMASVLSVSVYFLVSLLWRVGVLLRHRKRQRR